MKIKKHFGHCLSESVGRSVMSSSLTPWTIAHQAPLPILRISQARIWGGLPFLSPGCLPNLGVEPWSPSLQADSLPAEPPSVLEETQKELSLGTNVVNRAFVRNRVFV